MKKLLLFAFLFLSLSPASFAMSLEELDQYFTIETNRFGRSLERSMAKHDVRVTYFAECDHQKKEFIMSMVFDKDFFKNIGGKEIKKAKTTTLEEWSQSYKTNPQFKDMVDTVKGMGGYFKIIYSYNKGGNKLKSKTVKITPDEIIKFKMKKK